MLLVSYVACTPALARWINDLTYVARPPQPLTVAGRSLYGEDAILGGLSGPAQCARGRDVSHRKGANSGIDEQVGGFTADGEHPRDR
jgi:hypothetical protein